MPNKCPSSSYIQKHPPRVPLEKGVMKICNNFTGENPCRSVISMKLQKSKSWKKEELGEKKLVLKLKVMDSEQIIF